MLDKYGKKRIKLQEGDNVIYTLKSESYRFYDHIRSLKDSTVLFTNQPYELRLDEFDTFYFKRNISSIRKGLSFISVGFLATSLIDISIKDLENYNARDGFIIGGSLFAIGQLLRAIQWKKFKLRSNARIRILDTTFKK